LFYRALGLPAVEVFCLFSALLGLIDILCLDVSSHTLADCIPRQIIFAVESEVRWIPAVVVLPFVMELQ
jgi:hypothetical protein